MFLLHVIQWQNPRYVHWAQDQSLQFSLSEVLFPYLRLEGCVWCTTQRVGYEHVCSFWKYCQGNCHMLLLNIAFLWV